MRKLTTILLGLLLFAPVANAQPQGVEKPWAELPELPLGKYQGNNVITVGAEEYIQEHLRVMLDIVIPGIEHRLSSQECSAIPIVGTVDENMFRQGQEAVREGELARGRGDKAKLVIQKNTNTKWPAHWLPVHVSFDTVRTVQFYCVKPGVSLAEVEEYFNKKYGDDLANLERRVSALENRPVAEDRTDDIIAVVREEGRRTRDHVTDETSKYLGTQSHLTVEVGYKSSSVFNDGVTVGLGAHFPRWNMAMYLETFAEAGSHVEDLYYRPYPDRTVEHWGTFYSGSLLIQFHMSEIGDELFGLYPFIEGGAGVVLVDYDERNLWDGAQSIGFYDNGFTIPVRVGVVGRVSVVTLKLTAGQETYTFPWSPVYPQFADSEFSASWTFGFSLGIHFPDRHW